MKLDQISLPGRYALKEPQFPNQRPWPHLDLGWPESSADDDIDTRISPATVSTVKHD